MKVTKKIQYFIGDTQVLRRDRNLARSLGVSEFALRYWILTTPDFPEPIHTEMYAKKVVRYYPYEPAMRIIEQKLEEYKANRARGIGRPSL